MQLEDLYRSGKLSKTELEEMGIAERKFQAAQILDPSEVRRYIRTYIHTYTGRPLVLVLWPVLVGCGHTTQHVAFLSQTSDDANR